MNKPSQTGPVNKISTVSIVALAACPEGKEWGSVFRYISPQLPSGRGRLIENFIIRTQIAVTSIPMNNSWIPGLQE